MRKKNEHCNLPPSHISHSPPSSKKHTTWLVFWQILLGPLLASLIPSKNKIKGNKAQTCGRKNKKSKQGWCGSDTMWIESISLGFI